MKVIVFSNVTPCSYIVSTKNTNVLHCRHLLPCKWRQPVPPTYFTYLFMYLFVYLCMYLFIQLFVYLFVHLIIHLFIYSLIYSFIHSFIHVFIYLFICLFVCLFIVFQNPYAGVRPMDTGTVKE